MDTNIDTVNQHTNDRLLLTNTMDTLDSLCLNVRVPHWLAEDDTGSRNQVQAVRSQLEVHEEDAKGVGRLESRDGLLACLELQVIGERDELDASKIQRIRDMREREWRLREYQELVVAAVSDDLGELR